MTRMSCFLKSHKLMISLKPPELAIQPNVTSCLHGFLQFFFKSTLILAHVDYSEAKHPPVAKSVWFFGSSAWWPQYENQPGVSSQIWSMPKKVGCEDFRKTFLKRSSNENVLRRHARYMTSNFCVFNFKWDMMAMPPGYVKDNASIWGHHEKDYS